VSSLFYAFYTEFVRVVRSLKYDNDRLKEQMISRLNNKFLSASLSYLDLPYNKLVAKLHEINKRFKA
jgi:hypothetical protein